MQIALELGNNPVKLVFICAQKSSCMAQDLSTGPPAIRNNEDFD